MQHPLFKSIMVEWGDSNPNGTGSPNTFYLTSLKEPLSISNMLSIMFAVFLSQYLGNDTNHPLTSKFY